MLSLIASVAQEESRSASDNQKWRIQKCYERGEDVNTNQMFGYDISKHRFIPNEEEADVVNEIFNRIANGESYSSIARDLNRRGIKGKRGGKWAHHKISRLVANERLIGDCLLQKTFISDHWEKRHTVNHGERPMYYVQGSHEGIVQKELYKDIQAIWGVFLAHLRVFVRNQKAS
ncbi:MAG: recombinase family protein [Oscillospiraceae bacterium]|nr:recombinase family protein [Oscillospiraceae bacterium]